MDSSNYQYDTPGLIHNAITVFERKYPVKMTCEEKSMSDTMFSYLYINQGTKQAGQQGWTLFSLIPFTTKKCAWLNKIDK